MNWIALLFITVVIAGCSSTEYRVDRLEGGMATALPLRFDFLRGVRDGESVVAEAQFSNGSDSVELQIALHLGPPAQFTSGTYRATIGSSSSTGGVSCPSLTYLGGQGTPPSIGGIFELNDDRGQPVFRVRMPATVMTRTVAFYGPANVETDVANAESAAVFR
jgi:hypothetical protein